MTKIALRWTLLGLLSMSCVLAFAMDNKMSLSEVRWLLQLISSESDFNCALLLKQTAPPSPMAKLAFQALQTRHRLAKIETVTERLNLKFEGYRVAVPLVLKIIDEIKMTPEFSDHRYPLLTDRSPSGRPVVEYLTTKQVLAKLRDLIQSDFRVGYFPLFVLQVLMIDDWSYYQKVPDVEDWLEQNPFYLMAIVEKGGLPLPFPEHYGMKGYATGWTEGIVPMGIGEERWVEFDGQKEVRIRFWEHDYFDHALRMEDFWQLPENSFTKRWVRKALGVMARLPDEVLLEQMSLLYIRGHEGGLLARMAGSKVMNVADAKRLLLESFANDPPAIKFLLQDMENLASEDLPESWKKLDEIALSRAHVKSIHRSQAIFRLALRGLN